MRYLILAATLLLPSYALTASETKPQPKKFHPYSLILPLGVASYASMLAAIITAHVGYDYDVHRYLGITAFTLATIHTALGTHAYLARKRRLAQVAKEQS